MRRFRFKVPGNDGRPLTFPPLGPFNSAHWPDAEDIDDQGEQEIVFTDRFARPDWWKGGAT